jgi:hypothetical protein
MASFLPTMGSASAAPVGLIMVVMLAVTAMYFVIAYNMYNFAVKAQRALRMREELNLELGFKSFKRYNMILGIMAIVVLSIYALIIFILIVTGVANAL